MLIRLMKQYNENEKMLFDKNIDNIFRLRRYIKKEDTSEEDEMYPYGLDETCYYDLNQLEEDAVYESNFPILNVYSEDGEFIVEAIWFIGEGSTEEDYAREDIQLEVTEFELGLDDVITELKELVPEEPKIDPLIQMKAENKALELRVEQMKNQLEEDRRINEATTLEVLELMMSML